GSGCQAGRRAMMRLDGRRNVKRLSDLAKTNCVVATFVDKDCADGVLSFVCATKHGRVDGSEALSLAVVGAGRGAVTGLIMLVVLGVLPMLSVTLLARTLYHPGSNRRRGSATGQEHHASNCRHSGMALHRRQGSTERSTYCHKHLLLYPKSSPQGRRHLS